MSRSVHFSCARHNEFATRASSSQDPEVLSANARETRLNEAAGAADAAREVNRDVIA